MKHFTMALCLLFAASSNAMDLGESDKQLHLTTSAGIASITYQLTESAWASAGACIVSGFAKELYDKHDYGRFSPEDMQANAIGCGIGLAIGYLFRGNSRGLTIQF